MIARVIPKISWVGLCFLCALAVLSSCIKDDDFATASSAEGANLIITVSGMDNHHLTRADGDASPRTDRSRIEDMNIVLADAEGKITEIIYVAPNSAAGNPATEENGLVGGNLPAENGSLVYHIGKASLGNAKKIFIVCNYWQVNGQYQIIEAAKNLNNVLRVGTSTVDDLKALKQGTPMVAGIRTSTLFGEAQPSTGADAHGGQNYTCELKRTTAMVTVAVRSGVGDDRLNAGVKITPHTICLHQVPINCYIGQDNRIENKDSWAKDGLRQTVGWDALTADNHGTTVGGHGNDPNITPVFMFENKQGIMNAANTNEVEKAPDAGKAEYCSYIEVIADYLYVPQTESDNQRYLSGDIVYRLYLGNNITNDFNVERNKHYQVTLSLRGMGGLVEDGQTNEDGTLIANPQDLSWRVVTDDIDEGGAFLGDGLNMSSNGFLSFVGFVSDPGKEYVVYCKEGVSGAPWLWSQCTYNGMEQPQMQTPTQDMPAKVYRYDECGGVEGVSYIKLYAQPWIDDVFPWSDAGGNTLQTWISNGVRKATLILAEKTGSSNRPTYIPVYEFEVRQWLPMPVMVDDDGNPITTGNPNDASFYYSRIDVYEGKEMPWGPPGCESWDKAGVRKDIYTFYGAYPFSKKRDYNEKFGFDNMVSVYGTWQSAFEYKDENGLPASAMGVAVFRAGNALSQSDQLQENNFNELGRIGLPTIDEWDKIMKYGEVDMRFGISSVPYWTSTIEGTQAYSYNPITRERQLEHRRNVSRRTRLVYHKNDFAWNGKY